MASEPTTNAADAEAIARGYESRDVHVGRLAVLAVGFGVLFAVLSGGLWAFYRIELKHAAAPRPALSVVAPQTVQGDAPPLQPQVGHESLDAWDLAKMRAGEDAVFEQLGWARDPKTHRFVVPASVVAALSQKQAATPPAATQTGGR